MVIQGILPFRAVIQGILQLPAVHEIPLRQQQQHARLQELPHRAGILRVQAAVLQQGLLRGLLPQAGRQQVLLREQQVHETPRQQHVLQQVKVRVQVQQHARLQVLLQAVQETLRQTVAVQVQQHALREQQVQGILHRRAQVLRVLLHVRQQGLRLLNRAGQVRQAAVRRQETNREHQALQVGRVRRVVQVVHQAVRHHQIRTGVQVAHNLQTQAEADK